MMTPDFIGDARTRSSEENSVMVTFCATIQNLKNERHLFRTIQED